MKTMKAAVMIEPDKMVVREVNVPQFCDNEVLIQVKAVGVCGSDIHFFHHGKIGMYTVETPYVLGHECAGVVVAAGKNVKGLKTGDRVAVEPGLYCGTCEFCRSGRYNLCDEMTFLATPPVPGSLCEYIAVREDLAYPIPDSVSFEEAAMIEPLSVGIHCMNRINMKQGENIFIMGAGPVGLAAVIAAKYYGAKEIVIADIVPYRLEIAKKLGATMTINPLESDGGVLMQQLARERKLHAGIEVSGSPEGLKNVLGLVRKGGKIAAVAVPGSLNASINVQDLVDKELTVYGIFRYINTYPTGRDIAVSLASDIRELITHRYPLAQAQDAFEFARLHKNECIKVVIDPSS